jgi:transcriptional regulator with XRE-family HTH domain
MKTETKKRGGHITGFRADVSAGGGPVFEIRAALGYSQERLADEIGLSKTALRACERLGRWPTSRAVRANLRALAATVGVTID